MVGEAQSSEPYSIVWGVDDALWYGSVKKMRKRMMQKIARPNLARQCSETP